MKKLIALFMAVMICLSVCACGGNTAESETKSSESVSVEPVTIETTETPSTTEPVEESLAEESEPLEDDESPAEESEPLEDMVAVEEIKLTPVVNTDQTDINIKIRNLTDEPKDVISVSVQALDVNGDVITTSGVFVQDLEAGQGGNSGDIALDCPYDEINSLKIKTYSFGEYYQGSTSIWIDGENYQFSTPLVYEMSDVITEDAVESYIWGLIPN
jgi:hypothetical protein